MAFILIIRVLVLIIILSTRLVTALQMIGQSTFTQLREAAITIVWGHQVLQQVFSLHLASVGTT